MKIHENKFDRLESLKVDCSKCSGLCCIALFFSKMDGFPEDKVAGKPCRNLENNFMCTIHKDLEKRNMKGCIGYDCFGAGQYVTQHIYNGTTWKDHSEESKEIFDVFVKVYQLYQIRYYLEEANIIILSKNVRDDIKKLISENEELCNYSPDNINEIDIDNYRNRANTILRYVSNSIVKHDSKAPKDFLGRNFKGKDLSRIDLSMKLLIAANFDGCSFNGTVFLGADTRDTNFSNADLREAVFLTQGQINSAKGNRNTKLAKHLAYPVSWK